MLLIRTWYQYMRILGTVRIRCLLGGVFSIYSVIVFGMFRVSGWFQPFNSGGFGGERPKKREVVDYYMPLLRRSETRIEKAGFRLETKKS